MALPVFGQKGCNLPPRKIFFILEQLPKSVEALKLGPRAVKGEALTLLRRFLETVGGGEGGGGSGSEEGGKERPSLKSLSFAPSSVSPSEAKVLFAVLPASLETLVLKGNLVGSEGIKGLAEWIGKGKASSLLHLDLERVGLRNAGLETLCAAVEGKSLKVETLKLSGFRGRV